MNHVLSQAEMNDAAAAYNLSRWSLTVEQRAEQKRAYEMTVEVCKRRPIDIVIAPRKVDYGVSNETIEDFIAQDRYKVENPVGLTAAAVKGIGFQFVVNCLNELNLGTKKTIYAVSRWLSINKITAMSYKAVKTWIAHIDVSGCTGANPDDERMWNSERWLKERESRPSLGRELTEAIALIKHTCGAGSWVASNTEHEERARRYIHNLAEGWERCNNTYWWEAYFSPGLEGIESAKTFRKSCQNCGSPACPKCSLHEAEKQVGDIDFDAAYGHEFPILLHLGSNKTEGPKSIKAVVRKFIKKSVAVKYLSNTFGCWVPTARGYELQIMVKPSVLTAQARAELECAWSESGDQKKLKKDEKTRFNSNRCHFSFPQLPAAELAVELIMNSERDLFRLTAQAQITPANAWFWLLDWVGVKPGAKGMNRVFHGPGLRSFLRPDLTLNIEKDLLGVKSGLEESSTDVLPEEKKELKFPRTWFSLESSLKKGRAHRIWDPYTEEFGFIEIDNLYSVPSEYKTWKPEDLKKERSIKDNAGKELVALNPEAAAITAAPTSTPNAGSRRQTAPGDPDPLVNSGTCISLAVKSPEPKNPWGVESGKPRRPKQTAAEIAASNAHISEMNKKIKYNLETIPAFAAPTLFPEMQQNRVINTVAIENGYIETRKSAEHSAVKHMESGWVGLPQW